MILRCTCSHKFQDGTYGAGMRVHNPGANEKWYCTVCRATRGASSVQPVAPKIKDSGKKDKKKRA